MLGELIAMNAKELDRLAVVRKIVDKHLTQVLAAKHLGLTERQGLFCASVEINHA